jgi:tetratricopeptide (TPR) repeat protein
VGRRAEAVAPTEEAVNLYRELAATNPAYLPDLASALNNLGVHYSEVEQSGVIDRMWQEAIGSLADPSSKAFLLIRRATGRDATDPFAADDLLAAQALIADDDRDLTANLHAACRARRAHSPKAFDTRWPRESGALPGWLLIGEDDVELVWQWLTTSPEATAKQFLVEHTERLLTPTSDVALDEIALRLQDRSAIEPSRQLLGKARRVGIEDAYRPRLALELLENWLEASLEDKQSMLNDQRMHGELLGSDVAEALERLREGDPDDSGLIFHGALLSLARAGHDGVAFEALAEPTRFPALLTDLARTDEMVALDAMANLATVVDVGDAEQASGWFHKAIALAVAGDPQAALEAARRARRLDPDQATGWLGLLVELVPHHTSLIPVSQALAETGDPNAL